MQRTFKRTTAFGSVKTNTNQQNAPKTNELVKLFDFGTQAKYRTCRPIGPSYAVGIHEVALLKKDGKTVVKIPKPCLDWNHETGKVARRVNSKGKKLPQCPYCKMGEQQRFKIEIYNNVIDREEQENAPRKPKKPTKQELKTGFKDINSDSWTPAAVLRMTSSLAEKIEEINDRNVVSIKKNGKTIKKKYPLNHEKYGCDIDVKSNPKTKTPANYYGALKTEDGRKPLTQEEQDILLWDLSVIHVPETDEVARAEADKLIARAPKSAKKADDEEYDDDDEDDDEDDAPKSKKGAKKSSKKSSKKDADEDDEDDSDSDSDDEDDDSDDDIDEDDEDSDDSDDDEDDESDDDEDSDDDDDEPKSKKSKSKPVKASKKSSKKDDDDDEDEDSEDDDEDEDSEDDDEDDDSEDDDEDDEPAPKKSSKKNAKPSKKAGKSKPAKKSKKDDDDEDDDEDDDLDLDEDDDE